jgi:ubiquinone/menaquinone biosynthesis C-methylase UbiE
MPEFDIGYPHSKAKRIIKEGSRTIKNKIIAWRLDKEYYDGARENGYGGFRYDGRWLKIMPAIINRYGLTKDSSVLDLGCKKGFFMHDLKIALPGIKVKGVENHPYPIEQAMDSVKQDIILCGYEKLPFKDREFDFVMAYAAIYMLNLRGVMDTLREIQRVGKGKSYITVGAYRTQEERDLFLSWTLIGATVLHVNEWLEVFKETGYTGDYYFTTAGSLNLVRG